MFNRVPPELRVCPQCGAMMSTVSHASCFILNVVPARVFVEERQRELRRLVLGRKNWLFTWLDEGAERTGNILSIVATCIAHDVNPRAYPRKVVHAIVHGWPQDKLRELLPGRMLAAHAEFYVGDPDALPLPSPRRTLAT